MENTEQLSNGCFFRIYIHAPQKMNPTGFSDPLTLPIVICLTTLEWIVDSALQMLMIGLGDWSIAGCCFLSNFIGAICVILFW